MQGTKADNPRGTVVSLMADAPSPRAVVIVDAAACPRCAAGRGCGAGAFAGAGRERRVEAEIRGGVRVAEGDTVELALPPARLLSAAWLAYGLPLAGALSAAAASRYFGATDGISALAALTGLVIGTVLARRRLASEDCLHHFVPVIERRVESPATRV